MPKFVFIHVTIFDLVDVQASALSAEHSLERLGLIIFPQINTIFTRRLHIYKFWCQNLILTGQCINYPKGLLH